MRIVGGNMRGRNITAPRGRNTRPTSDQARESVFNILAHADYAPALDGAIVADIFAGSGALGLEAISRGAAFCLFVETAPEARAAIRENVDTMGLGGVTRLHRRDATKLRIEPNNLRGSFTHVFIDPPYGKNLGQPVLQKLIEQKLLAPGAAVMYEMGNDEPDPVIAGFEIFDVRNWGKAKVVFMGHTQD
ncbi:16S rRNA (guanine(966)-N(2))-methyltransferase RsmD [Robiginitomaculum antarcticum]|uniref:16S rRNA (guanine(966)-N(2))-methyltransferase RsmD n=1 Tax=Robiginitomaculum antarcticum TaxID=437507 RepID=UPI00037096A2|nr:16S rRNA (guanine(966)-N(2))-methyltransferase RsmD [Robiginitomaculum antarcticum]